MELGEKIRAIRQNQGLSQAEVEKRTSIKREYLSKIENNELKNPTYKTLKKICKGLGVTLVYLENYPNENNLLQEAHVRRQKNIKEEIKFYDNEIAEMEKEFKIKLKNLEEYKSKRLLCMSQLII